ncbi:MAG: 16S rRNA (cytosine(1402)-N(4))-methyltransferase RsmH [Nocardioides sp.]
MTNNPPTHRSVPAHRPVMADRVVELLSPALDRAGTVLLDATVGLGGHAEAVLTAFPGTRVLGVDRDPTALSLARERLASFGRRFVGVHAVYDRVPAVLADHGLAEVDAIFFDLGVSSMQLDLAERGFAYRVNAPLDMRMDPKASLTAAEVLNSYPVDELARVLRDYGEERFARRIAAAIGQARERQPFTTSARLVELVYEVIPAPARRTGGHPAKRTFQALRIEVNDELAVLERAIPAATSAIGIGGRVVVEAYHSLEDRLVKQSFAAVTRAAVPEDLPFVPLGMEPRYRLITRGAEVATDLEVNNNPRAASVRLRAIERTRS